MISFKDFAKDNSINVAENGNAKLFFMLGVAGLLCFPLFGEKYLGTGLPIEIWLGIMAICTIVVLFSVAFLIYRRFILGISPKSIYKELQSEVKEATLYLSESSKTLEGLEAKMAEHYSQMTRKGNESVLAARRIINAMEDKVLKIRRLLATGKEEDLLEAYDVIDDPLVFQRNSMHDLIVADPLPVIEHREWHAALERFIREAEVEFGRMQPYHRIDDRRVVGQ